MNKEQMVEAIAKKTGLSKKDAANALATVLDVVQSELSKGHSVVFTGFGTFAVAKRKAREGVNPRTGEKIKIAATKVPKFKAGRTLKDVVK